MLSRRLLDAALAEMADNPGQLEAVGEHRHCAVLAGPGSGKTKTLTTAMARTLLEDVADPRGVACITYSNECAIELEQRLAKLGVEPSQQVFIGTVHSFALAQVLSPYARCVLPGWPHQLRIANAQQQKQAVETAYRATINQGENPQERWRFATEKRKRDVDRSRPDWMGRNPELARFIERYEAELRAQGLIDFDDMPILALKIVREHRWVREALRARFPVLFVDEYQDLGHALHELVLSLCFDAGIRLFAVGDVDQSIYGFNGANPELLQSLTERPDVHEIRLRFNYRSGEKLISASMAALGEERGYQAPAGTPEGIIAFRDVQGDLSAQARYIALVLIPELLGRGVPLEQIGILYRNASHGTEIAEASLAAGIPIVRADNQALVKRNSRLSRFLEAAAGWAAGGWKDAEPPFRRLSRDAVALVYGGSASDPERQELEIELISFLQAWLAPGARVHDWLQAARHDLIAPWRQRARSPDTDWSAIDEMIQRTLPGSNESELTLATFSGRIEGSGRLNLSTLHSAKGREFDAVILFGMNNDEIPNYRDRRSPQGLLELRRLFYVGVTRPRRELYLVFQRGGHSPWVKELHDRLNQAA